MDEQTLTVCRAGKREVVTSRIRLRDLCHTYLCSDGTSLYADGYTVTLTSPCSLVYLLIQAKYITSLPGSATLIYFCAFQTEGRKGMKLYTIIQLKHLKMNKNVV